MVKEVGELELGEGLSEEKLQEPGENGNGWIRMRESAPKGGPGCPYIEFGVRLKKGGSPDRRVVSLREEA